MKIPPKIQSTLTVFKIQINCRFVQNLRKHKAWRKRFVEEDKPNFI